VYLCWYQNKGEEVGVVDHPLLEGVVAEVVQSYLVVGEVVVDKPSLVEKAAVADHLSQEVEAEHPFLEVVEEVAE